ncbi:hypothetical protein BRE01_62720 [Brevibacillus reuszeri]|uniref:Uncharacterized protein n=1 Tax=Brevibacillus reuszeri TaxID=54915 RepID=A0A0K9YW44_9BACL|nr:hypothetical protein [Brevibacillus reuszeri]KNB72954.1 hypothetical protein ADS79_14120 [Brevibacillus reuszeri]GED72570.1 hypothetical protein BRE01_62720 [Brevibacillus reuszeri]
MLTLVKGKSRKSQYMELFHKGSNNSLFIQYGHNIPMWLPDRKECWIVERSDKAKVDLLDLESELMEVMAQVLDQTEYHYIFLYGNFELNEVETVKKVASKVDGQLNLIISVQDNSVPDGQTIIEELRLN